MIECSSYFSDKKIIIDQSVDYINYGTITYICF